VFIVYDKYILFVYKKYDDYDLFFKLRAEGKITTPGLLFAKSDRAELEELIDINVLRLVFYSETEHAGAYIFKSYIVREIKDRYINKPYKKLYLVVQGYSDNDKYSILT